jgi:hypothetical protein
MTNVSYYYAGDVAPKVKTSTTFKQLSKDKDPGNPIFNFSQDFINKLNTVSPIQLAQSQPYVSLKTVGLDGKVKEDLNLSFFMKPMDMASIGTGNRYSDRPAMSLKDVEISTDLASGYLYYTNVTVRVKIHKPDVLASTSLIALLFPGMPLILEYGWNSPNEFLNEKERMLFAVRGYDLSFDATGQIDLTISGMAFNERFNNTLVGDFGDKVDTPNISNDEFNGIEANLQQIEEYVEYLDGIQKRVNANSNDYKLVKNMADSFKKAETKARGIISKNFSDLKVKLNDKSLIKKVTFGPSLKDIECINFHDVVYTLCQNTFTSLTKIFPSVNEFRIVYGTFNANTPLGGVSIAEFPIHLNKLNKKFKEFYNNGQMVPTVEALLNILVSDFIDNEEYWKGSLSAGDLFEQPDIVFHFTNRGNIMELLILDINNGLPITTVQLPQGKASDKEAEDAVISGTNMPVIRLGHANSFIKTINLSQIADENMKAVLIERMSRDRLVDLRSTIVPGPALESVPVTPLTLPLQGNASVLGHIGWKPFRAFYLSAGLFLLNAVYKITKVSHRLGADGFKTDIEFMWH